MIQRMEWKVEFFKQKFPYLSVLMPCTSIFQWHKAIMLRATVPTLTLIKWLFLYHPHRKYFQSIKTVLQTIQMCVQTKIPVVYLPFSHQNLSRFFETLRWLAFSFALRCYHELSILWTVCKAEMRFTSFLKIKKNLQRHFSKWEQQYIS